MIPLEEEVVHRLHRPRDQGESPKARDDLNDKKTYLNNKKVFKRLGLAGVVTDLLATSP